MALHQRFFQAAQIDFDSARILAEKNRFQPALYHMQQAFEKCIKSQYISKETTINKTAEDKAYKKIKTLGHDIEESTIVLLHEIGDLQRRGCKIQLCNTSDPEYRQAFRNFITAINGLMASLDNLVGKRDLKSEYVKNVKDYTQYVKRKYDYYQKSTNEVIPQQPDPTFVQFILIVVILYPCFYKMNEITRYPLTEFSYKNLDLITNLRQPCENIIEILGDLFSLLRPLMR